VFLVPDRQAHVRFASALTDANLILVQVSSFGCFVANFRVECPKPMKEINGQRKKCERASLVCKRDCDLDMQNHSQNAENDLKNNKTQ